MKVYVIWFNDGYSMPILYIYIYIYIYIVIHWQTVSLYHNALAWLDRETLQARFETLITLRQADDIPLSQCANQRISEFSA